MDIHNSIRHKKDRCTKVQTDGLIDRQICRTGRTGQTGNRKYKQSMQTGRVCIQSEHADGRADSQGEQQNRQTEQADR